MSVDLCRQTFWFENGKAIKKHFTCTTLYITFDYVLPPLFPPNLPSPSRRPYPLWSSRWGPWGWPGPSWGRRSCPPRQTAASAKRGCPRSRLKVTTFFLFSLSWAFFLSHFFQSWASDNGVATTWSWFEANYFCLLHDFTSCLYMLWLLYLYRHTLIFFVFLLATTLCSEATEKAVCINL